MASKGAAVVYNRKGELVDAKVVEMAPDGVGEEPEVDEKGEPTGNMVPVAVPSDHATLELKDGTIITNACEMDVKPEELTHGQFVGRAAARAAN
jgi:hypothetical protein